MADTQKENDNIEALLNPNVVANLVKSKNLSKEQFNALLSQAKQDLESNNINGDYRQYLNSLADKIINGQQQSKQQTQPANNQQVNTQQSKQQAQQQNPNMQILTVSEMSKFGDNLLDVIKSGLEGIGLINNVDYKIITGVSDSNGFCPYYSQIFDDVANSLNNSNELAVTTNKRKRIQVRDLKKILSHNIINVFVLNSRDIQKVINVLYTSNKLKPNFSCSTKDLQQIKDVPYKIMNVKYDKYGVILATICITVYFGKLRTVANLKNLKRLANALKPKSNNNISAI